VDQATVTLKNRHVQYENDLQDLKERSRSPLKMVQHEDTEKENNQPHPGMSMWGKPISPAKKTKSYNAMFQAESNFD